MIGAYLLSCAIFFGITASPGVSIEGTVSLFPVPGTLVTPLANFLAVPPPFIPGLNPGIIIPGFAAANFADAFTISATSALVNRNILWLAKSSFEATAAKVGTSVTTGSTITVPSNTTVNAIFLRTFGGTQYYEVQLSASYTGTFTPGTSTVTFSFIQPPYAQPGETVFSFVAAPGDTGTLDLGQLKELTNTTLGGRGTFPNGPDVLAINVYKVSGDAVVSNIILRWGEAQA